MPPTTTTAPPVYSAPPDTTTTIAATAPSAPTSVSGTSGDTQVSVSWSAPASNGGAAITDYVVQYSTSSSGTYTTFSDGTSTLTTATVTGLTNNTIYYFKVAAVNYVGTGSYSTVSASVTPRSVPPVVSSVTAGDGSLTFTWNAITHGGDNYRIYWGTDSTFATAYTMTGTTLTTYTATGLTNGTTYYFRVAGWNNSVPDQIATTDWSTTASGVPGAASAPTSVVATSGRSGMSVSWTAPSSNGGSAITDYLVQYATTSGGAYTTFSDGTSTTTSATITGLTAGSTYYVRVAAVNALTTGTYSAETSGVLSKTCADGGVCAVGDTGPGGGKVFYVSASAFASTGSDCGSNCYSLEAAPSDHSPAIVWATIAEKCWNITDGSNNNSCQNYSVYSPHYIPNQTDSRTAATAIGEGMANTNTIYERFNSAGEVVPTSSYAAGIAWAYSNNSKTDWFLPSTLELNQLCRYAWNLTVDNTATTCTGMTGTIRSGFSTVYYWSSSEYSANGAWLQLFTNGAQDGDSKASSAYLRPVRAF